MERKYFVTYKYSLLIDIWNSLNTWKLLPWLKKHNLRYILPSIKNTWKLAHMEHAEPRIETSIPITCYWVSSGTWGSYKTPETVYICPWEIDTVGGIESVIQHEILHLERFEETKHMTQEEKEAYIEHLEQKN